jgi:hypothetical protein
MNLKAGDKVKFLNDTGGGVITGIVNDKQVKVLIDEGFELPVKTEELVLVEPAEIDHQTLGKQEKLGDDSDDYTGSNNNDDFDELEDIAENQDDDSEAIKETDEIIVYYGLVPVDQKKPEESELELYLINDSNYKLLYQIGNKKNEVDYNYHNLKYGFLEANTKVYITSLNRNELNQYPDLLFQFVFLKNKSFAFKEPVYRFINVHPVSLYEKSSYKENDFFDEKACVTEIYKHDELEAYNEITVADIEKALHEKRPKQTNVTVSQLTGKRKLKQPAKEIDLHIHELVEDETGLTDADKLELQLIHFRRALEKAIDNKEKKIVFVHGVGNGRLKHELRKIIDEEYAQATYQDASFQKYGIGGTLVLIK